MKTKKVKIMMPAFAIMFAIVSAFATNVNGKEKSSAIVPGYLDAPEPCEVSIDCSDTGTIICTAPNGQQVFGKENPNGTTCSLEVYQLMP